MKIFYFLVASFMQFLTISATFFLPIFIFFWNIFDFFILFSNPFFFFLIFFLLFQFFDEHILNIFGK
jgi:hypothetical protein